MKQVTKGISCLVILVCLFYTAQSQHLKRKGQLGIKFYQQLPDSLKARNETMNQSGVWIEAVIPGSTADRLQLKPLDLITGINQKPVAHAAALLNALGNVRADDTIEVEVWRNQQRLLLKGVVKGRPFEVNTDAVITYGDFAFDGGYVRTLLKRPKGLCKGTVFYLQGISCYSVDPLPAGDPVTVFLDGLLRNGYAVFLIDKPGMGDSYTQTPCSGMGFNQELELFTKAYQYLLGLKGVDEKKVCLFGHSLGGVIAPLVAERNRPAAVAVYGTVLRPWYDYLYDAIKFQDIWAGVDMASLQTQMEQYKPILFDLFYNPHSKVLQNTDSTTLNALKMMLDYHPATGLALAERTPQFHIEINKHNLPQAWKNTTGKVLAMYGEGDVAALNPTDHELIATYVNQCHPGNGTFKLIKNTNHTMQLSGTIKEQYSNPALQDMPLAFNPEVLTTFVDWLSKILEEN
jgi:pimeloyl-ACP methyl ester carboxylesterase